MCSFWPVCKLLLFLCVFFFFFCFSYYKKKKKKKKNKDKKTHKRSKIFRKNHEAVKWISGKRRIVYYRWTCNRHTLVFGIRKAWPPPIEAREIDGLPKASMVELLVTKQDPNFVPQTLNVSELLNIVDFAFISQFMQWIQKSSVVWNQIRLDLANPSMKHVMIIWTHEYR